MRAQQNPSEFVLTTASGLNVVDIQAMDLSKIHVRRYPEQKSWFVRARERAQNGDAIDASIVSFVSAALVELRMDLSIWAVSFARGVVHTAVQEELNQMGINVKTSGTTLRVQSDVKIDV